VFEVRFSGRSVLHCRTCDRTAPQLAARPARRFRLARVSEGVQPRMARAKMFTAREPGFQVWAPQRFYRNFGRRTPGQRRQGMEKSSCVPRRDRLSSDLAARIDPEWSAVGFSCSDAWNRFRSFRRRLVFHLKPRLAPVQGPPAKLHGACEGWPSLRPKAISRQKLGVRAARDNPGPADG